MQRVKRVILSIFSFAVICILMTHIICANEGPVFKFKNNEDKKIALTFDDGPHPVITKKILDILDKYGVKATFFVVGVNVKNYPSAFECIVERGHEIGNHTYSHTVLNKRSKEMISKEIDMTEERISSASKTRSSLIRPPCGEYDETLVKIALENDYKIVLWNIDTKDWAHVSKKSIIDNVMDNVNGGDIILFHDYISGKNNTVEALDYLIPKLISDGYEFVSVSELLQ